MRYVIRFCCRRRQEKKERKGKERKGRGRESTQSHKTLYLAICGADTPRPIPIKFGMLVAPRNVINVSNFCDKIFRGFRSTEGQIPRFPIDFAGHRYNSAALPRSLWKSNMRACWPTQVDFFGMINFDPYCVQAPQTSTHARDRPMLASEHPKMGRGPP